MRLAFIAFLYLLIPAFCLSATIHVPADYATIQGAIDAAKKGDVVLVDPGTYVENIQFKKSITVQSTGGAAVTVIDGNQSGSVVYIDNLVNKFSLLDGFTITNGSFSGISINHGCWPTISNNIIKGNKSDYCGGGIVLGGTNCCPKIMNNLITENVCTDDGGGIYCSVGGPRILDNEIVNNTADSNGGGIHCRYLYVSAEITGNTISQNTAGSDGGGIYCFEVDLFNISGNTISQNAAGSDGGGIGRWFGDGPTISDNLITGNSAVGYGGGIDGGKLVTGNIITDNMADGGGGITGGTSAVIRDNTITGNSAEDRGGGLCGHFSELTGNIISNNTAVFDGGGLYCDWATVYIGGNVFSENLVTGESGAEGGGLFLGNGTSATLINNLIINNRAVATGSWGGGRGGGLSGRNGDSALLINNTFYGNRAEGTFSRAGGFCWSEHSSIVQMINNILWNNEAGYAKEIYMEGGELTVSYTAVEGGQDSVEIGPTGVLHWGQGMIDEEPLFLDPGGDDFCLDRLSPCINRGDNEAAPPEDFDGNPRPFMGTCDMGAFEFVGDHTLSADLFTLSESTGGLIQFNLEVGLDNPNRPYLILGSLSGTSPGMLLPGGMNFRLNMDPFTFLVYATANSPFFPGFLGVLDGAGTATAQLNTQGPIAPGFLGEVMSFSYALVSPCDFVSNPVSIEIVD